MKKWILAVRLLSLSVVCLFWGPSLSEGKEISVRLTQPRGLVTLDAVEASFEDVMEQLSRECGFRYHLFPELKGNLVSAHLQNRPLKDVLKELLGDNHIVKFKDNKEISAVYALDNNDPKLANRNRRVKSYLENKFFPLQELQDIVKASVQEEYPEANQFLIIPREDIKGELKGYIFSYFIGSGPVPTVDSVRLSAGSDWASRRQRLNRGKEAASMNDTTNTPAKQPPSLGADKSMRRSHEFVTVEVSADFSSPPIKKFHMGLPDDLTMYPAAEEILAKRGSYSSEFNFVRTFMLSPLSIGFEFRDRMSMQSYYVDVLKRQVFVSWGQKLKAKSTKGPSPERESRIERQWLEILSF